MPGRNCVIFAISAMMKSAGFGLTEREDLLLVHDIALIKQQVSSITVALDDMAVADFFEDQVELGRGAPAVRENLAAHPSGQLSGTKQCR